MPGVLTIVGDKEKAKKIHHHLALFGKMTREEGYKYYNATNQAEASEIMRSIREPALVVNDFDALSIQIALEVKKLVTKTKFVFFSVKQIGVASPNDFTRLKGFFGDDASVAQVKPEGSGWNFKNLLEVVLEIMSEEQDGEADEAGIEEGSVEKASAVNDFFKKMKGF